MAFHGHGASPLSSIGSIWRKAGSSQAWNGLAGRGTWTRQPLNHQFTDNKVILVEGGWKSVGL
jgi:hypothetical protein